MGSMHKYNDKLNIIQLFLFSYYVEISFMLLVKQYTYGI